MTEQAVEAIQHIYRSAANGEASGLTWLDERFATEHRSAPGASEREEIDDPRWKPERFFDLRGRVLVRVKLSGRGNRSGDEIETRIAHLWSIRRDRSVRLAVYHDWQAGLDAAGLAE